MNVATSLISFLAWFSISVTVKCHLSCMVSALTVPNLTDGQINMNTNFRQFADGVNQYTGSVHWFVSKSILLFTITCANTITQKNVEIFLVFNFSRKHMCKRM